MSSEPCDVALISQAQSRLLISNHPFILVNKSASPFLPSIIANTKSSSQPRSPLTDVPLPLLKLDCEHLRHRLQAPAMVFESKSCDLETTNTKASSSPICLPSSEQSSPPNPKSPYTSQSLHYASSTTPSSCQSKRKASRATSLDQSSKRLSPTLCTSSKSPNGGSMLGKVSRDLHPTITIDLWGVEKQRVQPQNLQPSSINDCVPV